jgi:MFS family permease
MTGRLALFLAAMAVTEAMRAMTSIQIPIYLRSLGANVAQVGFFFSISAFAPVVLMALGGWLSDTMGRLLAFYIGCVAGGLAYIIYAISPTWEFALLAPPLQAVSYALIRPSYRAYIADHTRADNRGRVFAIAEMASNVTWIFGGPLGGFITQNIGFYALFLFTATGGIAAGTVAVVMIMRAKDVSSDVSQEKPSLDSLRTSMLQMTRLILSGGLVTWLLITDGIRDVAFRMSFEFMPVYLRDEQGLTLQQIGFLDGIFGVVLVLAGYPAGWLTDRAGERITLVSGLAAVLASRLAFVGANSFLGFAGSWSLLAIGVALMDPALQSLISKAVPQRLRGITWGLLATSWGIVSMPSPWIGGLLWTFFGPKMPFLATVVLGSLALIPAWFKLAAPKSAPEEPPP